MFVPSLAVGATGGRLMGRLVKLIVTRIWPDTMISLTSYSIIGAAAFLGGSTRMTLTTTVMVMETTGALQLIVPIMLTVFFAKFVGDQWGLGIDDTHIKLRGAPYLVRSCILSFFLSFFAAVFLPFVLPAVIVVVDEIVPTPLSVDRMSRRWSHTKRC